MGDTPIEWTDKVWNPVTGCTKVSQGCKHCYAERLFPRPYPGRKFSDVRCHPERLTQPLRARKPKRFFVNSMSDLFHDDIPTSFLDEVFAVMAMAGERDAPHTFQVLTKRPERMRNYLSGPDTPNRIRAAALSPNARWLQRNLDTEEERAGIRLHMGDEALARRIWPLPNVWLGVSVEDQATADERIPLLLETPAAVRFVSAEPLLGPVDLNAFLYLERRCPKCGWAGHGALGSSCPRCCNPAADTAWLIVGGESGPGARPMHPDWVRSLRDQCVAAGVPFFFKQWGEWKVVPGIPSVHMETEPQLQRVGKKQAGRTLDGRHWNQFPEVPHG